MFGDAVGGHFVADLYTHLNDVLHALGRPPEIDEVVIEVALDHYLGFVGEMLDASEWGIVELCSERSRWQLGTAGLRRAELSGSAFELLRVFSARRSIRQIRALHWTGDIDALLVLLDRGFQDGYTLPMLDMIEAS